MSINVRKLWSQHLFGGNCRRQEIAVSAAEINGEYEIMALRTRDGEELENTKAATEEEAKKAYDEMLLHYLGPLQQEVFKADLAGKLVPGEKYTLFCLNDFGFPVAQKITYKSYEFTTYAQYDDVIDLYFVPARKRSMYHQLLHETSFAIFKGWQEIKKENVMVSEGIWERGKYGCFDSRYFDDGLKLLKNPVVIYKKYETGVDGKTYA